VIRAETTKAIPSLSVWASAFTGKAERFTRWVRVNGKLTWKSTGTSKPADARKWLEKWRKEGWMLQHGIEPKGVSLHRKRISVGEMPRWIHQSGLSNAEDETEITRNAHE